MLTLFSLRPVYQVGCYAYYEMNIDMIIEQYCENTDRPELNCDGKCYLAKTLKLQQAQSRTDSKEQAISMLIEAFCPLYYQDVVLYIVPSYEVIVKRGNKPYSYILKIGFQDVIKPPPRVYNT
ncbi:MULTISPECIES: hypothetical protein [Nonlabens]|uniref:hypothetical protein n=1 Tax=Nonlabens TaxID=363408 RepID=UPI002941E74A|nr:hypothetical protein [Nonlabens ulvanivorans]WOI22451.1 hypothetical protein R1T42_12335 [Nonlabens ulvanivorans]